MNEKNLKSIESLPTLSTLGQRLAWARNRKNLTQKALAEKVGVDQTTISLMERDMTTSPRKILYISDYLDVSPAWLQFGIADIDSLDERDIKLALLFHELPTENKAALEQILSQLSNKTP